MLQYIRNYIRNTKYNSPRQIHKQTPVTAACIIWSRVFVAFTYQVITIRTQ